MKLTKLIPYDNDKFKNTIKEFSHYVGIYFPSCKFTRKIYLSIDVLIAYFRYGAWINNYFQYEFYSKPHSIRKEFLTWKKAVKFINKANGKNPHSVFRQKNLFNKVFSDYIKRDWVFMADAKEAECVKFFARHPTYIEKPVDSWNGVGVSKKEVDISKNLTALFREYAGKPIMLEEYIVACDELAQLHPASLNTIRVATLLDTSRTTANIVAAVLRIGASGSIVDNLNSGGFSAAIDLKSGIISHKAVNLKGEKFDCHPNTGKYIVGLKIPAWNEIVNMCKDAAMVYTDARFVGWDVAVSFDDETQDYVIQIIEGNDRQDLPLLQVSKGEGLGLALTG